MKVSIIAPSSGCQNQEQKLAQGLQIFQSNGFECLLSDSIFSNPELPFFAAKKELRLKNLQDAISKHDSDIIWAFRGGYGATEIVFDCLELTPNKNKILIGYSDITALHLLFNQRYNMPSIHGSVITSILSGQQGKNQIFALLKKRLHEIKLPLVSIKPIKSQVEGELIGGNLTVLCQMIGTKLAPQLNGKILVLEDVNEDSYRIHRNLMHLKNSGILSEAAAVIFGDFIKDDSSTGQDAIYSFCTSVIPNIPTYKVEGVGHGNINHPLILGNNACIIESTLNMKNPFKLC